MMYLIGNVNMSREGRDWIASGTSINERTTKLLYYTDMCLGLIWLSCRSVYLSLVVWRIS